MYNVFLRTGGEAERDLVMARLDDLGIETRPVFYPMHQLPPYRDDAPYPVADMRASRGVTLPMHQGLRPTDIDRIAASLAEVLDAI
jgi:perosamine synthetase